MILLSRAGLRLPECSRVAVEPLVILIYSYGTAVMTVE
jgi:hypothetical protein